MKYTLLSSHRGRGGWSASEMLTIHNSFLMFISTFRDNFELKRYATFFSDEEGYFCFKLSDEESKFSYKITRNKVGGYFVRKPSFLQQNNRMPNGKYKVVERDGYYVTDCKLNLAEEAKK